MNDIYVELKNYAEKAHDGKISIASSVRSSQYEGDQMVEFRRNAERIRVIMRLIKQNNDEIEQFKSEILTTTSTQREKDIQHNLQELANQNLMHTNNMKKLMDDIDSDIKQSQDEAPGETETLAKIYQKRALQSEIQKLLSETQTIHQDYKQGVKKKIDRQLQLLDPNLTKDKRQELLEDPEGLQKVLQKQTLGTASIQLRNKVDDIIEKTQEIKRLEKSYEECFRMLSEIAFLVHVQGEILNDVEDNLEGARDYIKKAAKILTKEKEEHQKSRKKLCCIIIMGLLILGVLTAPLWIKLIKNA